VAEDNRGYLERRMVVEFNLKTSFDCCERRAEPDALQVECGLEDDDVAVSCCC
jgi:hypothetical protein